MKYDPDVFDKCSKCDETEIKEAFSQLIVFGGRYAGQVVFKCGHFNTVSGLEGARKWRVKCGEWLK